jgi:hypothetical protein
MLLIMYDPCVIVIERRTRETLKEVAKKHRRTPTLSMS